MAKTRREFTPEFKQEAVALWEDSGRPQVEIAAELGLQPSQLRRWQKVIHGSGQRSPHLRERPPWRARPHRRIWRLRTPGCGASSSGLVPSGTF